MELEAAGGAPVDTEQRPEHLPAPLALRMKAAQPSASCCSAAVRADGEPGRGGSVCRAMGLTSPHGHSDPGKWPLLSFPSHGQENKSIGGEWLSGPPLTSPSEPPGPWPPSNLLPHSPRPPPQPPCHPPPIPASRDKASIESVARTLFPIRSHSEALGDRAQRRNLGDTVLPIIQASPQGGLPDKVMGTEA